MNRMHSIINNGDESWIVVIVPGGEPLTASDSHPNFATIVAALTDNDTDVSNDELADLFDASRAVAARFERLSERVTVRGGTVYFDGDAVDSSITEQIVRFLDDNVEDWRPLVSFMEKVAANPNDHSREQLYDWLRNRDGITLTDEGDIVGYKGVGADFLSIHSGRAIVDGEPITGRIPNRPGSVVEMPRTDVAHDPSAACSTGLHVGTYDYAQSWAQGGTLEVHVNPRDVVSVPTEANGRKIRVCRYKVVQTIEQAYTSPVLAGTADYTGPADYDDDETDDIGECDACGATLYEDDPIVDRSAGRPGGLIFCDDECADDYDEDND